MKILLAVDGSDFGGTAVNSVANRPWPANTEVKIITVMEPFQPYLAEVWAVSDDFYEAMDKSATTQATNAIEKALEIFQKAGNSDLRVSHEIIKGNPRNAILDEAETWNADLIVVGSHGYTGLKRVLLGSVSQAIASHAKCSVEIVRNREIGQQSHHS
jgi:nucleotide-binding universal stress UspA family protein